MSETSVGERIRQIREEHGLTRAQMAERMGVTPDEIRNIECNRLKRPDQKESFYRSVAAEFGVSLDWLKTGQGRPYGEDPADEISTAFGELAARHDPVIDGFIQFLRSRTPEQLDLIAQQLTECIALLETAKNAQTKTED